MAAQKPTTGSIRANLAEAVRDVRAGKLDLPEGRLLVSLANQISKSLTAEAMVMTVQHKLNRHVEAFGSTKLD